MDFTDEGEDIFAPANHGLEGLFRGQKDAASSLKYQAPKALDEPSSKTSTAKSSAIIVAALTWDGNAYQPVGKLGLALLQKDSKAFAILYKSKQQTLSMIDLTAKQLQIEQHSDTMLATLDSNGRAWTLQFDRKEILESFVVEALSARQKSLGLDYVAFTASKGSGKKIEKSCQVKASFGKDQLTFAVEPEHQIWHQNLIGLQEHCALILVGNKEVFEGKASPIKVTVLEIVRDKPKLESRAQQHEETTNSPANDTDTESSEESQNIFANQEIKAISHNLEEDNKPSFSSDLVNLIITENRLQNTELRLSMMKMTEKLDQVLASRQQPHPNADLRKVMNKMFKQLKSQINPGESYQGSDVLSMVASCMKSAVSESATHQ